MNVPAPVTINLESTRLLWLWLAFCAVLIFGSYYEALLGGEETQFPALSRRLLTPLIASPFEPGVLNVLPITGLAVATAPSIA